MQTIQDRRRHTYNSGAPYSPARGRQAPRRHVEEHGATVHPVVALQPETAAREFLVVIRRELKIRFYQSKTIRNYLRCLTQFLRWYDGRLNEVTTEDVRCWLELLVDGGAGSSHVGGMLSAIRTAFDKLCGLECTRGLATPRKPHRLPVVLSTREVARLLKAAPSLRDKLLLGVMYATGMRVSEVVKLRWEHIDFERRTIRIVEGKGRRDRVVMLPDSFGPVLRRLSQIDEHHGFVFPGPRRGRYLSPRTAQRAMQRAVRLAGITKPATCHSLRHSFATHLLESGTDVRFIQKLLGHARLETTTIYAKVAVGRTGEIESPLDRIARTEESTRATVPAHAPGASVGMLKLSVEPGSTSSDGTPRAACRVFVVQPSASIELSGIALSEPRPGWLALEVPPLESWQPALAQLTAAQRERITSPEFYDLLHRELSRRYVS